MDDPNPKEPTSPPSEDTQLERRSLHIQAIVNWMIATNGGHLPAAGAPDKAIDSLMESIGNLTLDSIPADVHAQVPGFAQLTEDALKSIVLEAAKLSITDEAAPAPSPHQWDQQTEKRCWTNGTSECSCRMPGRLVEGVADDELEVLCGLDCPIGCSQEEIGAAAREGEGGESSPWCGTPGCVCTAEEDHVFWLCAICGQAPCICVPESVEHDYDPFCERSDCTCLNRVPSREEIVAATFGEEFAEEDDIVMFDVGE